jgi:hypothetical protein
LPLTVDGVVFKGFLKGVVREDFAFLLRQERCLRRIVDGGGDHRTCSLGGHHGMFYRRTNGGRQMLEIANSRLAKLKQWKNGKQFDADKHNALGQ